MNNKEGNGKGKDPRDFIYVETAYNIMQKCLETAKKDGDGNPYSELAEALAIRFFDQYSPDENVLRNLHNKIKQKREKALASRDSRATMGITIRTIKVLANFVGVNPYDSLDRNYIQTLTIPVMYAAKPWPVLSLIRVTDTGKVTQDIDEWRFTDSNHKIITGRVHDFEPFIMPGDKTSFWLKVIYNDGTKENTAYFAEHVNHIIRPCNLQSPLYSFFSKMRDLSL